MDMVVGLERRYAPGLWIPNTEAERWDPSHPERHTELMTTEPKQLRVTRAHAIRLAKAENKRTATPSLCSFNIEAIGWMFVERGMDDAAALLALWADGARDLRNRLTPDPAGVSAPIKVPDREEAVRRLSYAAQQLASALDNDDNEIRVREALRPLWPDFVAEWSGGTTKARIAARLQSGGSLHVTGTGALGLAGGVELKRPRSFGGKG